MLKLKNNARPASPALKKMRQTAKISQFQPKIRQQSFPKQHVFVPSAGPYLII